MEVCKNDLKLLANFNHCIRSFKSQGPLWHNLSLRCMFHHTPQYGVHVKSVKPIVTHYVHKIRPLAPLAPPLVSDPTRGRVWSNV